MILKIDITLEFVLTSFIDSLLVTLIPHSWHTQAQGVISTNSRTKLKDDSCIIVIPEIVIS